MAAVSRRHCKANSQSATLLRKGEQMVDWVPRNRREKRLAVLNLPREFRIHVHARGQWRKQVIKNGELTRP